MLTTDTKRHIDAARQVLVGSMPNPISQVQEITNALIYKFMDDMDEQAAALGGKRRYFTGEYEKYSWRKIMSPQVGAQARVLLYQEAIKAMGINPDLPKLFQQIFQNANVFVVDGNTLSLFLHEINYFDYKHSEELGNAYEYLLSIMGSQGDAGQFRTPRHIIDFIVAAVDPGKDDTVLDPACGTAGFLISAYKHVMAKHDGKDDSTSQSTSTETPLTADEKKNLYSNYKGFDIDPSMVKMSQVNMFLHGFTDPKILIHDSLTSEDFWPDKYDVILANPPFMSPKGGIIPHKKFSIQSNRAEVLFVDYIMSHLKPNGRAGVIVPEGIIFQNGTAYRQLRKNLIEDGLYAVVSLPSGVFNPYSGVKTSILLFNNVLAKKKKEVLFIKISADGYDLGAQRRKSIKDDLPSALEILAKWHNDEKIDSSISFYVPKAEIAQNGDYDLSSGRYQKTIDYTNVKWPMFALGDICDVQRGTSITRSDLVEGSVPVIAGGQKPAYYHNLPNRVGETITISGSGAYAGFVNYFEVPIFASDCSTIQALNPSKTSIKYLYYLLKDIQDEIYKLQSGMGQPHVYAKDLKKIKVPLPPIEIQAQIVAELDGYSDIIAGARKITKAWKPRFPVNSDWEKVKLDQVCEINPKKSEIKKLNRQTEVSFVPMSDLSQNSAYFKVLQTKKISEVIGSYTFFAENDVLLARVTPCFENGKVGIAKNLSNKIGFGSSEYIVLRPTEKILSEIIYAIVASAEFNLNGKMKMTGTGGLQRLPIDFVRNWEVNLPPLSAQKTIIEKFEAERKLVESSRKLIPIFEQKIKETIAKLWEE